MLRRRRRDPCTEASERNSRGVRVLVVDEVLGRVNADEGVSRVLDGDDSEAGLAGVEIRAVEAFLSIKNKFGNMQVREKSAYPTDALNPRIAHVTRRVMQDLGFHSRRRCGYGGSRGSGGRSWSSDRRFGSMRAPRRMSVVSTSATFLAQSREDGMHVDMTRLFNGEEFVAAVVLVTFVGITRRAHVVI